MGIGRPPRTMPDDFPMWASIEGNRKLRKRFGTNGEAIERWRRELGVRFIQPVIPRKVRAKVVAVKRVKARYYAQEQIEDLEAFDVRSLGYGRSRGDGW